MPTLEDVNRRPEPCRRCRDRFKVALPAGRSELERLARIPRGQKMELIRVLRLLTGCSLADVKGSVQHLSPKPGTCHRCSRAIPPSLRDQPLSAAIRRRKGALPDYAVYIMVATHRISGGRRFYVGKTGDNRKGCNPVISRAGNHFSFNTKHSQMRNFLKEDAPEKYDFDYFYSTFGSYVDPEESRESIDLINEMERRLSRLAQAEFGDAVIKPYGGKGYLSLDKRRRRDVLATPERVAQLYALVAAVRCFVDEARPSGPTGRESLAQG